MRFSGGAERFLRLDADRLVALASLLAERGLRFRAFRTGSSRHLAGKIGGDRPLLALAAHYDRVPGSPGVLDNSCACLQLADFAARYANEQRAAVRSGRRPGPSILVAFTDAEEAAADGGAGAQGSLALARALRSGGRRRVPPVMVLDVTGRGTRLAVSSTPAELLAKNDLADSPAARGHEYLCGLASRAARRARLPEPARLGLPWSDDLGLVLGGVPALAVTLLPEAELAALRAALAPAAGAPRAGPGAGEVKSAPAASPRTPGAGPRATRAALRGAWPRTWELINGPADGPELAEEAAFDLMARFLDAVAAELAAGGEC